MRNSANNMLDRAEFLDGRAGLLSLRRSGFVSVLQHDVPIEPHQMGGPLVDRSGRLIGINIARRSREAVLAIPAARILEELKRIPSQTE